MRIDDNNTLIPEQEAERLLLIAHLERELQWPLITASVSEIGDDGWATIGVQPRDFPFDFLSALDNVELGRACVRLDNDRLTVWWEIAGQSNYASYPPVMPQWQTISVAEAAAELGVNRSTLHSRIERAGIPTVEAPNTGRGPAAILKIRASDMDQLRG